MSGGEAPLKLRVGHNFLEMIRGHAMHGSQLAAYTGFLSHKILFLLKVLLKIIAQTEVIRITLREVRAAGTGRLIFLMIRRPSTTLRAREASACPGVRAGVGMCPRVGARESRIIPGRIGSNLAVKRTNRNEFTL